MRQATIHSIDLNADLGEHDGDGYEGDEKLLAVVSSASIACGGHAGSLEVMEETARRASDHGVAVGAHPSYPDREGFGRRETAMRLPDIAMSVKQQLETLLDRAAKAGAPVRYLKPHGALYNRAMKDDELAGVLVQVVAATDPALVLLALPDRALARAAAAAGLRVAREAFIDRAYSRDGSLVPRSIEGAIITDVEHASERALTMAREGTVETIDGTTLTFRPDSMCVHSDSVNALALVKAVRTGLTRAGFSITSFA